MHARLAAAEAFPPRPSIARLYRLPFLCAALSTVPAEPHMSLSAGRVASPGGGDAAGGHTQPQSAACRPRAPAAELELLFTLDMLAARRGQE